VKAADGSEWKLRRLPPLDGLRGLACVLVLLGHELVVLAGGVGVAVFFTLSGFLITALLLNNGELSTARLGNFYESRVLRLLPGLLAMVFAVAAFAFATGSDLADTQGVVASVFYYSNWLQAFGPRLHGLQHTWSLAVEEQFYLVWPLLMLWASRFGRRGLFVLSAGGALLSVAWRVVLYVKGVSGDRIYFGSDTRADGLLIGCFLAVLLVGRAEGIARPRGANLSLAVTGLLCWVLAPAGVLERNVLMPSVIATGTAIAIWCVCQGEYRGWLNNRILCLIGERSYGIYLWSMPVGALVHAMTTTLVVAVPASLVVSLGVAGLSFRYVESPFLRLKARRRAAVAEPDRSGTGFDPYLRA
jgi:peptidoglycan/LPS O-acetylase OafA/YrhL